jgi:hypothetical protein
MRPLKSHCRDDALTTLETVCKQTREARVLRRAQAVRVVVSGQHITIVSAPFHFANSTLSQWVQRFATQEPQGLRYRLSTRPLRQGQSKHQESLKRQAWWQNRSWSRLTSGVWRSVMGAVQYGTSKVF